MSVDRPADPAGPKPSVDETPPTLLFPVVGVGASAGGLEAFTRLLEQLPADAGMALVLVQHLDPHHASLLSGILSRAGPLPVTEAKDGMPVERDHVYVIPPNASMAIARGTLVLRPRAEGQGKHLPIDHFLRSLADDQGNRAIGVVLSGGGTDATLGLEAIKAAGGITFAQEEKSAKHPSMPRSAVAAGGVDFVLPPEEIARELVRIACHSCFNHVTRETAAGPPTESREDLAPILRLLRGAGGVDFTHYKRTTIGRRIQRRMALRRIGRLEDYALRLQDDPAELEALYQDCLIRVTSFFRAPVAFEALRTTVFPTLLKDRAPDFSFRAWVPGCSSGEEVYSLAICLLEFLGDMAANTPIKLLATDVNQAALEKARSGTYLENISGDVSPERLRRFFTKVNGQYQISKTIRELCVFAEHNVFRDPPFSRLDLTSCRNLLIYLDIPLQKRVLPLFHYALKPTGYLLLGVSETVGPFNDLFTLVDKDAKLYARKSTMRRTPFDLETGDLAALTVNGRPGSSSPGRDVWSALDVQREADRLVLGKYAPAGVLVDDNLTILQFRGQTGPYLEPAPGAASLDLLKMARGGLAVDVRAAVDKARKSNLPVRVEALRVREGGRFHVEVIPLQLPPPSQRHFLVLFKEEVSPGPVALADASPAAAPLETPSVDTEARVLQVQQELDATREYLQSLIEKHETVIEELKSINEEVLSSNEELQSTNEELQTAKEEMQSINEELATVNEELNHRNLELAQAHDDLVNLFSGVNVPIVMVGRDLCIRRFTAPAEKILNLIAGDVGRPLGNILTNLRLHDLDRRVADVIDSLHTHECEVQDRDDRWHLLRIRPYKTQANKIDGAVIVLIDVDALKRGEQLLRAARDYSEGIVDTVREGLVVLDADLLVLSANRSFYRAFQTMPEETVQRRFLDLGGGWWNQPRLSTLLQQAVHEQKPFQDFSTDHDFAGLGRKVLLLNARPILPAEGQAPLLLLSIEDVTERALAEEERHRLEIKMQQSQRLQSLGLLAAGVAHDFNNLLTAILGNLELAQQALDPDSELNAFLTTAEMAARRAAELTRHMLSYSGRGRFVLEVVNLSTLVREMTQLLESIVSKHATVQRDLAPDLHPIEADPTQICQVIMNLLINASEALQDKAGTITLRTGTIQARRADLDSPYVPESPPEGTYAFVEVADTGCGMTELTRGKIFDPFFSTKFTGRGLGLAAVLGIIRGHRGTIQVTSEPGRGSIIRALFPCSARPPAPAKVSPQAEPLSWRGSGTILLVEDEPDVRKTIQLVLEKTGFQVLTAVDGREALEIFRKHCHEIVFVLLDLIMPNMSGWDVLPELRRLQPGVPVLIMSGANEQTSQERLMGQPVDGFLQKPFNSGALIGMMRNILRV
jgi:two-component system, chemotaxis family, CheB/CheR fusion protein